MSEFNCRPLTRVLNGTNIMARAPQPAAIPDVLPFTPLRVIKSMSEGLYYLEVGEQRYYGTTPKEALGVAVLDGVFGHHVIEMPE